MRNFLFFIHGVEITPKLFFLKLKKKLAWRGLETGSSDYQAGITSTKPPMLLCQIADFFLVEILTLI